MLDDGHQSGAQSQPISVIRKIAAHSSRAHLHSTLSLAPSGAVDVDDDHDHADGARPISRSDLLLVSEK